MAAMDGSQARWHADLAPFGASAGALDAAHADVARRYGEAARHYHTMRHVEAVLAWADELLGDDVDPAVVLAAWLHDVIYDPTAHDNEAASAVYAGEVLPALGVPAPVVAEVRRLIELTAGHEVGEADRAGRILVDADLAILGSPWPVYATYAANVRQEYAHVPDEAFRPGRAAVLEGFVARPRLFHTDAFHARFDEQARANLGREIDELRR